MHGLETRATVKSSRHVLLLVILQILAAFDGSPPAFVRAIPVDRGLNRFVELVLWAPTQLALHFASVDRIPTIMTRAVFHVFNAFIPALSHELEDRFDD